MKTSTRLITAVLTGSCLILAMPFAAHAGAPERGAGCAMHAERGFGAAPMAGRQALEALALSEAQRDRIFELRHQQAPAMRALAKTARESRNELRALALSGDYDAARAAQIAERGAQAMAKMATLRAQLQADIYALLDDPQRARLRERPEIFEPSRRGGGHGGPGRMMFRG